MRISLRSLIALWSIVTLSDSESAKQRIVYGSVRPCACVFLCPSVCAITEKLRLENDVN